ncbi:MAG: tetratricopeptide repeat protein [Hyphomicrobiales bacterium]|nr:tetratricopeptide repeat protein [Hyphomicrobiales bacterium]
MTRKQALLPLLLSTVLALGTLSAAPASAADAEHPAAGTSPFADAPDREKLRRRLQRLVGGTEDPAPTAPRAGAHRPKDPHAALGPESMIRVALQHQDEGRPGLALDTLGDALRRYPGHPDVLLVRGSLLLQQDRTADALRDLEAAAQAAPGNPAIYVNRAQAYRRFGNTSKAMADLDRAVELAPDNLAARFNRGSMHFNGGRFDLALADFERCVAVDPHAPPPHFNLAMTRAQMGDRDGAVADLRRFLELADSPQWRDVAEKKLAELTGPARAEGKKE